MNFQSYSSLNGPLYCENTILKIANFINCKKNALFVRNTLKKVKQ